MIFLLSENKNDARIWWKSKLICLIAHLLSCPTKASRGIYWKPWERKYIFIHDEQGAEWERTRQSALGEKCYIEKDDKEAFHESNCAKQTVWLKENENSYFRSIGTARRLIKNRF